MFRQKIVEFESPNVFLSPDEIASVCLQTDYCEALMGNRNGSIFKVVKIEPSSFNFDNNWTTVIPLSIALLGRSKREYLRIDRCCPEIEESSWLMSRGSNLEENVSNNIFCLYFLQTSVRSLEEVVIHSVLKSSNVNLSEKGSL